MVSHGISCDSHGTMCFTVCYLLLGVMGGNLRKSSKKLVKHVKSGGGNFVVLIKINSIRENFLIIKMRT